MISLKRYLDLPQSMRDGKGAVGAKGLFPAVVAAYRSALVEMGNCGQDACPALGEELKRGLLKIEDRLAPDTSEESVEAATVEVREQLQGWGKAAARHYREKTSEVKGILLTMAHAAESLGERDQRAADQIAEVTARLSCVANLEDLTEIRVAIEKSASELKSSIDRMTAEGKAALEQLRGEVCAYQARLEEAELKASRDGLTGLGSRGWVEGQIERALLAPSAFCVAMIDIDGFKQVNDRLGHTTGDGLLRQFAGELRSASRSTDVIGRWGGDEFVVLLNCPIAEARAHTERLKKWVCGSYSVQGSGGEAKLAIEASFGLAERQDGDTLKELIDRADAQMYEEKAASRAGGRG